MLKREVATHRSKRSWTDEEDFNERSWTVEVAATATICNLIADFSPLKAVCSICASPAETRQSLLRTGGIEILCELTLSTYEPLALNALWAVKNLTFHALDGMKLDVMTILGWGALRK